LIVTRLVEDDLGDARRSIGTYKVGERGGGAPGVDFLHPGRPEKDATHPGWCSPIGEATLVEPIISLADFLPGQPERGEPGVAVASHGVEHAGSLGRQHERRMRALNRLWQHRSVGEREA